MNNKRHVTDDDEEYSNMYREAKKAHHQKLLAESNPMLKEQASDNDSNSSQESDDDKKEFFHFFAIPVLKRDESNTKKKDDSWTNNSSVLTHSNPTAKSQKYNAGLNYKKSYLSFSTTNRNGNDSDKDDSSSSSSSNDEKHKKMRDIPQNIIFDSALQQETIGETLFESTNLKGCKKMFYVYLFMIACFRFMCFRTEKPIKYASILVFLFITLIIFDIIVTFNLFLHMKAESIDERIFSGIGIYYFFLYPGIAIFAPI